MTDRLKVSLVLIALLVTVSACDSCTTKPGVATTPFTPAARATDDVAGSIQLIVAAESNLESQKLITPPQGLTIMGYVGAVNKANVQFRADLQTAIASGNKTALRPSLDALKNAVSELQNNGLLGLNSDKAKQVFAVSMSAIGLAIGVLDGFVGQ